MLFPFLDSYPWKPFIPSLPLLLQVLPPLPTDPPTYTHLPQWPSVPLSWVIKPPQDQGAPLPVMPDKAILCYISSWSHGSPHVYSLLVV